MAHPRVLKRANGTRQVQISWGKTAGKRQVEYVGSGRTDEEVELLLVEAWERINAGQGVFDLGLEEGHRAGEPLEEVGSRMAVLWDGLEAAYRALGLDEAAKDRVFRDLVLARIIEPTSKRAAIERVLPEVGGAAASYRTVSRRLKLYSAEGFREECRRRSKREPVATVEKGATRSRWRDDQRGCVGRDSAFACQ